MGTRHVAHGVAHGVAPGGLGTVHRETATDGYWRLAPSRWSRVHIVPWRGGAGRAAVRRGRFDSPPGAARRGGPWARAFRLRRDGRLVQRESGRPMGRDGRAPGLLKLCGAARFSRSRSRPVQAYPGLPHLPPRVISRWVIMPPVRRSACAGSICPLLKKCSCTFWHLFIYFFFFQTKVFTILTFWTVITNLGLYFYTVLKKKKIHVTCPVSL